MGIRFLCEGNFCRIHEVDASAYMELAERVGRPDSDITIISKNCPTFEKEKEQLGEIVAENAFLVAFAPKGNDG